MLKKVIIGILCFVILAFTGFGIYVYTLDWNEHKGIVTDRFSEITGLKTSIDGDLNVEIFPTPRFSAHKVRFSKGLGQPLVVVNEISANVNFWDLFSSNFVLDGMTLSGATINVVVSENGEVNWDGVGSNGHNRSGNVEVSFDDIRFYNCALSYKNLKNNDEFTLNNIRATVNASSLRGPFQVNGSFIHNESEIKFGGNVVNGQQIAVKMNFMNAPTSSKLSIDSIIGNDGKGNVIFETARFADLFNIFLGEDTIAANYNAPLYVSFSYDSAKDQQKLNNFNVAYGQNSKGTGAVIINSLNDKKEIIANLDMAVFDLNIFENIARDIIASAKGGHNLAETIFKNYAGTLDLKSTQFLYRGAEGHNLSLNAGLGEGIITVENFGAEFVGGTILKLSSAVALNQTLDFQVLPILKSSDLRTFASLFGIDLAKYVPAENKKNVFKKAEGQFKISGNLNELTIAIAKATVDATDFKGNIGYTNKEGKGYLIADLQASKILFDRYFDTMPQNMEQADLDKKLAYHFSLLPFGKELDTELRLNIASAAYAHVPLENVFVEFKLNDDILEVNNLRIADIAGASLDLKFNADKIFTTPTFKELNYNIATSNFQKFTSVLGISMADLPLFKRKIFAAQGAFSGTLNNVNISSLQKFGDDEFSYTGTIDNALTKPVFDGNLELKTNNFASFVRALDIDYTPDIPVTSFTLVGKVKGEVQKYQVDDVVSYLGANVIKGMFAFDKSGNKPVLSANLEFDKFDADHLTDIEHFSFYKNDENVPHTFIAQPLYNDEKIDYKHLQDIDFNITAKAKQLICFADTYSDAVIETSLKNGVLGVKNFSAAKGESGINVNFNLNSNNIPEIEGNYQVTKLETPDIGGSVYVLEKGMLTADGHFRSVATSVKEFMDNLSSDGRFRLKDTAMDGWDFDLIKFDLEQRKTKDGLEDSIKNNLKSGRSVFAKISGKYNISKGIIVTDNALWESPVVNINMSGNFNLSNWLFSTTFSSVYQNASFADVLGFSYSGNISNPALSVNISDSIKRIGDMQKQIDARQKKKEEVSFAKVSDKLGALKSKANRIIDDIEHIRTNVAQLKPKSDSEEIIKVYDSNQTVLQSAESRTKQIIELLNNRPNEKNLIDFETELGTIRSKLMFIPKTLEDNYVMDGKYIFEGIFNKIVWVYNIAENNSAYYMPLANGYLEQISLLDTTETPVDDERARELEKGVDEISETMSNITELHNKIRESYLGILDTTSADKMVENNDLAERTLQSILDKTQKLNGMIISSIEEFRSVLDIKTKDYDEYMMYLPDDVSKIDVNKPALYLKDLDARGVGYPVDENKKKSDILSLDFNQIHNEISSFFNKLGHPDGTLGAEVVDSSSVVNEDGLIEAEVEAQSEAPAKGKDFATEKNVTFEDKTADNATQKTKANLESKMQASVDDIMSQIKNTEQNLKDFIKKHQVSETKKNENAVQTKNVLPVQPDFNSNPLVVAKKENNIGAPIADNINAELKQKADLKEVLGATAVASDNNKQNILTDKDIKKQAQDILQPLIRVSSPMVPEFDANKNNIRFSTQKILTISQEAPVSDNLVYKSDNQYVFYPSHKVKTLRGMVEKMMYADNTDEVNEPVVRNQYVFAKNTDVEKNLSGSVHKNISLYVK